MRTRCRWAGIAIPVAFNVAACGESAFRCESDDACVVEGVAGSCESNGVCAFPDEDCASGRRYGQQAPAELAGVCVDDPGGSTSSSGSGSGESSGGGSTGSGEPIQSSSSTSSSSGGESSSSTGEPGPTPNVVFVSSASVTPSATVVSEADMLCNQLASDAGLPGTYVAWLSSAEFDAIDRLEGARGWVRPDGMPFADRAADIVEGRVYFPPVLDELGTEVRGRNALTGTVGTGAGADDCEDWTDFETGTTQIGSPGATFPGWTGDRSLACDDGQALAVYCFGIDVSVPVEHEPASGRIAFASNMLVDATVGLDGLDAVCTTEAAGAGLEGSFKAFVAADDASALSRFDTAGEPWVNMYGVPIASTAIALTVQAHLDAPFNITATGEPVGGYYWTGSTLATQAPNGTCGNWTGRSTSARRFETDHTTDWFAGVTTSCTSTSRVVCFQE